MTLKALFHVDDDDDDYDKIDAVKMRKKAF